MAISIGFWVLFELGGTRNVGMDMEILVSIRHICLSLVSWRFSSSPCHNCLISAAGVFVPALVLSHFTCGDDRRCQTPCNGLVLGTLAWTSRLESDLRATQL